MHSLLLGQLDCIAVLSLKASQYRDVTSSISEPKGHPANPSQGTDRDTVFAVYHNRPGSLKAPAAVHKGLYRVANGAGGWRSQAGSHRKV